MFERPLPDTLPLITFSLKVRSNAKGHSTSKKVRVLLGTWKFLQVVMGYSRIAGHFPLVKSKINV